MPDKFESLWEKQERMLRLADPNTKLLRQLDQMQSLLEPPGLSKAIRRVQTLAEIAPQASVSPAIATLMQSIARFESQMARLDRPLAQMGFLAGINGLMKDAEGQHKLFSESQVFPPGGISGQIERYQKIASACLSAVPLFGLSGETDRLSLMIASAIQDVAAFESKFRLPAEPDFNRLTKDMFSGTDFSAKILGASKFDVGLAAMQGMHFPWAEMDSEEVSAPRIRRHSGDRPRYSDKATIRPGMDPRSPSEAGGLA